MFDPYWDDTTGQPVAPDNNQTQPPQNFAPTWTFVGYRWPDNKKIFRDTAGNYGAADTDVEGAFIRPQPIQIDPSALHPQKAGATAAGPDLGSDPGAGGGEPAPAPPPAGGGTGGTGLTSPSTFEVSSSWPKLTVPPVPTLPPFSYDAFAAPSLEDARNEPGYAFARDEGIKALENSKAARGILRTGGTLKDILKWGDQFGEQNYGNVYNRAANTYSLNRNNAFDTWRGNTDLGFQTYDRQLTNAQADFAPKQRQAELTFDDLWRRWQAGLNATAAIASAGAA